MSDQGPTRRGRSGRWPLAFAFLIPSAAAAYLGWSGEQRLAAVQSKVDATAEALGVAPPAPEVAPPVEARLDQIAALAPQVAQLRALETELRAAREENAQLKASLGAAQADAVAQRENEAALVRQRDELQVALATAEARLAELAAEIGALQGRASPPEVAAPAGDPQEVERLRADLAAVQAREADGRAERARLDEEVASLRAALATAEAAIADGLAAVERLTAERDSLADSLAAERGTLEARRADLATTAARLETVTAERDGLAARIVELEAIAAETDALRAERDAFAGRLAEAVAPASGPSPDAAIARTDLDEVRRLLERSEADLATRDAALAALEREVGELRQQLAQALPDRSDEIDRYREELGTVTAQLGAAERERAALQDELAAAIAARNAEVGRLRTELSAAERERDGLRAALETGSAEQDDVLSGLRAELTTLAERLAEVERERDELRRQLSDLAVTVADPEAEPVTPALRLAVVDAPTRAVEPGAGPLAREVARGVVALGTVLFDIGEASLTPAGRNVLIEAASELQRKIASLPPEEDWILRIEGHTDDLPTRGVRWSSNWQLSAARASTVAEFLVAQGLPAERMMAAGFAETRPAVPGSDADARRMNRRTDVLLAP